MRGNPFGRGGQRRGILGAALGVAVFGVLAAAGPVSAGWTGAAALGAPRLPDGEACPLPASGGTDLDAAQEFLGEGFVDSSYTDSGLVIGVHGLTDGEIAALESCAGIEDVVARPVSVQDMSAAQELVMERLAGLVNTVAADYATGTIVATASATDLDLATATAQADPELAAMIATPAATPDQVRLEFAAGPAVVPAPEPSDGSTPSPSEPVVPPVLRQPQVAVAPTTALAGATVRVTLTGTEPNLPVRVVLRPAGTVLADWVTDVDGNVAASLTLPAGLATGDYVLAFVWPLPPNEVELATQAIKVGPAAGKTPGDSATDLPRTGPDPLVGLAVAAGLALAAGAGGVILRRRSVA
ncbi:MAG: LPXTG cell wall anchor domain-containing protein [Bifidobacteriaceae bacterium]|nr:LPXTG cell wall anchor domain-containing protein [Bifidobacteriaceae bacterium]